MSDEPNLRALERAMTGQPQGWGEFPPGKPSRPLPTQDAGTAPAANPAPPKLAGGVPVGAYEEPCVVIPGFWMSLLGLAASPIRAVRWMFRTPTRACVPLTVILFVLATPLFVPSGGRDARRAEGEQMLGSLKNQARVAMAKADSPPWTLTGALEDGGCNVDTAELEGKYYMVDPRIELLPDGTARLRAYPRADNKDQAAGYLTFTWGGGDGRFQWMDAGDRR